MFIRTSQMQIQPGSIANVMGLAEQLATQVAGLAGLQDYYLVQISETEVATIGIWETAEAEQAASNQIRGALMQQMGAFVAGRPQSWAGAAVAFVKH